MSSGRALAPEIPAQPVPRHAYFTQLVDDAGEPLDQGLFLYFQAPASFTGEDVVELHAHGSPRLLELLLARVLKGAEPVRLAEPGEFTRRAFQNGRMDLTRAEAVADLVSADSEAAVRAAAAQIQGALAERLRAVKEPLLGLHADLEGVLSFPDEADGAEQDAEARLRQLAGSLQALLAEAQTGALVRRGARVVLFGPVNAGKSSLFNRLVGAPRALVDPEPGTTRDVIDARLELSGVGLTLVDTAGFREGAARLEVLGIERTREALRGADVALLVLPPRSTSADVERWRGEAGSVPVLLVSSKQDLGAEVFPGALSVSAVTGTGLEALRAQLIAKLFADRVPSAGAWVSERHADALRRAEDCVARARSALEHSTLEVVAGEVAMANEALGEITGENAGQALLDEIFRRFCIGK